MTKGRGAGLVNDSGSSAPAQSPESNFASSWESCVPQLIGYNYDNSSVFPIPPVPLVRGELGTSVTSRRRRSKFVHVHTMINECIDGLNELYGCSRPNIVQSMSRTVSPCHVSVHDHIKRACLAAMPEGKVPSPQAAARLLLGRKFDYFGTSSSVEAYDPVRVSLPDEGVVPVPLSHTLAPETLATLASDRILADDDVVEFRQLHEPEGMYTDVILKSDKRKRYDFYARLFKCGILGFSREAKAHISPFFVTKKNGKQRLVLDCRRTNQFFRKPHRPELGPAEAIQRIENTTGSPLYEAEADLKNCFYQMGIEEWLSLYFCFEDRVPGSFIQDLGCKCDVTGVSISRTDVLYPCLVVLPMGFSWSFWIVQELVTQLSVQAGVNRDQILVSGWPAPALETAGVVANPYCDNLNLFGLDPGQVNAQLDKLLTTFRTYGFDLHEISYASTQAKPLGSRFCGVDNRVGPRLEKLHNLRATTKWMSSGRRVSGQQVEVLLGLFTHEFLYNRSAFSVFRAAYTFVQKSYYVKQPLWDSVAREFLVAGFLLPLVTAKLDLVWDPEVRCSDASTTGWGASTATPPYSEIQRTGVWDERWRFVRLPPEEWRPRRRAFTAVQSLDCVEDPRTLGNQMHVFDVDGLQVPVPSELEIGFRKGFPETQQKHWRWRTSTSGWFEYHESISVKEARAAVWDLERTLRDPRKHNKKHLRFVDNFGVSLAFMKGRATSFGLLSLTRRLGALKLACGVVCNYRWIPSEDNHSDEASRLYEHKHLAQASRYAEASGLGKAPSSREAVQFLSQQQRLRELWLTTGGTDGEDSACGVRIDEDASDDGFFCGRPKEKGQFTPLGGRPSETQIVSPRLRRSDPQGIGKSGAGRKGSARSSDSPIKSGAGLKWSARSSDSPIKASTFPGHQGTARPTHNGRTGDSEVSSAVRETICSSQKVVPSQQSVSGASRRRCHPCRLPRCEVGSQDADRRCREGCGSSSLPMSRSRTEKSDQSQSMSQRVQKVEASRFSTAAGGRCGMWSGGVPCSHGQTPHSSSRVHQLPVLSSTRRSRGSAVQGCRSSDVGSSERSGMFHTDDSPQRARSGVQGPNVRRHHHRRQTRLAWRDLRRFKSDRTAKCPALPTHHEGIQTRLGRSLQDVGSQSSPVSVAACRGQSRHLGTTEVSRGDRRQGTLDDQQIKETVCQGRCSSASVATTQCRDKDLVLCAGKAGSKYPDRPSQSVPSTQGGYGGESHTLNISSHRGVGKGASGGHGFVHRMYRAPITQSVFLECCAGTCRLARACCAAGVPSESFEIVRDKHEDICSGNFLVALKHRVSIRKLLGVWLGITCASFSLARRGNPDYSGWPPPLRSSDSVGIWGLPNLNAKDRERVRLGNKLAKRAATIIRICIAAKIPVFLENPANSRLWIFPPISHLLHQASQVSVFHQCQYNSPYKKPTKLAMWNFQSEKLALQCTGTSACSCSGVPHSQLSGIDPVTKEFRTAQASAYPWRFAEVFATEMCDLVPN